MNSDWLTGLSAFDVIIQRYDGVSIHDTRLKTAAGLAHTTERLTAKLNSEGLKITEK